MRFGYKELVERNIETVNADSIPDHALLTAGFPCQAFSVAGKRKGFQDTRGTLFYHIARVAEAKRPPLLLLENVKGLLSAQGGYCFKRILETLGSLGYLLEWQVLNSKHFGVPQNRERVFLVGHLGREGGRTIFPVGEGEEVFGEKDSRQHKGGEGLQSQVSPTIDARYGALRNAGEPYIMNIPHGFNEGWRKPYPNLRAEGDSAHNELLIFDENIDGKVYPRRECPTLRSPNAIWNKKLWDGVRIRRLTPVECERLQGFPDGWTKGVSDTQRYKLLGNAVTVNVVEFLGRKLRECLS